MINEDRSFYSDAQIAERAIMQWSFYGGIHLFAAIMQRMLKNI